MKQTTKAVKKPAKAEKPVIKPKVKAEKVQQEVPKFVELPLPTLEEKVLLGQTIPVKPTPAEFLTSEGIIFYGTPKAFTEDEIINLLSKYSGL